MCPPIGQGAHTLGCRGPGRTWEAMRYVSDQRPVDGPLRTRVYANEPGPLYLTHGLLDPALTVQRTENVEGTPRVFSETYAAEPWAPALAGLPYEARFQPLSSGTERVVAGGKREPEGGTRLVRWDSWLGGQK